MVTKFVLNSPKSSEKKEEISRALQIASNYAGELSIEVIPLDKIELDPDNNRDMLLTLEDAIKGIDKDDPESDKKRQEIKSLESIANTIKNNSLINPVYVYRYGNKCRLIAGERRTLASAIAGKKEIIARVASTKPNNTKLRVLQWIENHERSDLTLRERIASLEAIIQEYYSENKELTSKEKLTAKLLSDLTGMSMTQARRYILILECNDDIKKGIEEGKLDNIKLIELLCSTNNKAHQSELLTAALAGKTLDSIIKLRKHLETNTNRFIYKNIRNVKIGNVKLSVAKLIINSLISSSDIDVNLKHQITNISNDTQWNDEKFVTNSLKKIISLIESKV